jgi:hypothetical protein
VLFYHPPPHKGEESEGEEMITPGILWIVIGVLLLALYICCAHIMDQQKEINYYCHRLDSLLEWAESIGRDVSDGQ